MNNLWNLRTYTPDQIELSKKLSKELGISPILTRLLIQRGITTQEDARTFFEPKIEHLHDPFLMKDMDIAVERLNQAIGNKERIMVYGDYDVDGTTSVALVYSFIRKYYSNIEYYIPNRYGEGYGVSVQGIDYAAEQGSIPSGFPCLFL